MKPIPLIKLLYNRGTSVLLERRDVLMKIRTKVEADDFLINGSSIAGAGSEGGSGVGKKVYREEKSTDAYKIPIDWIDTYLTFRGSSDYGEVFNSGSETIGISATATGLKCQALAPCSFAEGRETKAHGICSHASGYGCEAGNTLWSYQNTDSVSTNASITAVADGYFTKAYGKYSGSHGFKTCAYGDASVAFGKETEAIKNNTAVFGLGTSDQGVIESGFVIGKYNELTSPNAIFVVGGGSSTSNRKNLLAVDTSGNLLVAGKGEFSSSVTGTAGYFANSLESKSIAKRIYAEDGSYITVPVAYKGDSYTTAQSDGRYVKITDMGNFNGAIGATSGYFGDSLQAKSIEKRIYNEDGSSYYTVPVLYDGDCYTVTQADNTFIKKVDLTNPTRFLGVTDTKASLSGFIDPENGSVVIVKEDETNDGKRMSYIYTSSGWVVLGEESVKLRDFITEPIDLSSEVVGTLKQANMDLKGYVRTEDLAPYAKTETLETVAQAVTDLTETAVIKDDEGSITVVDIATNLFPQGINTAINALNTQQTNLELTADSNTERIKALETATDQTLSVVYFTKGTDATSVFKSRIETIGKTHILFADITFNKAFTKNTIYTLGKVALSASITPVANLVTNVITNKGKFGYIYLDVTTGSLCIRMSSDEGAEEGDGIRTQISYLK